MGVSCWLLGQDKEEGVRGKREEAGIGRIGRIGRIGCVGRDGEGEFGAGALVSARGVVFSFLRLSWFGR